MSRWEREELGSIVDLDREEARSAARFDRTDYVRINGQLIDADRVPALSDIPEEDWRE